MSPEREEAMHGLRRWMFDHVYHDGIAKAEEGRAQQMIEMLYEYYMATLDMKNCRELPVPVLIYFQYDNRLQLKQKAFLFRYVIEHEKWLGKLFEAYDGIIKAFTFEQLQKGVINEDIAVLYHHYLTKEK